MIECACEECEEYEEWWMVGRESIVDDTVDDDAVDDGRWTKEEGR